MGDLVLVRFPGAVVERVHFALEHTEPTVMMDKEASVHGHEAEPLARADHLSFTTSLL